MYVARQLYPILASYLPENQSNIIHERKASLKAGEPGLDGIPGSESLRSFLIHIQCVVMKGTLKYTLLSV